MFRARRGDEREPPKRTLPDLRDRLPGDPAAHQYRLILDAASWSEEAQIDAKSLIWFDAARLTVRGPACAPIRVFTMFGAMQHGTIITLATQRRSGRDAPRLTARPR